MPILDWIGKEAVVNHHLEVPYRLLKCDSNLSAGDPEAGNLLVQGDNLLALKALLPYYAGQVKCIYIDPPYNTGNENWVYNDNVNSPEIKAWINKVVGKEGEDLSRHDKWLCMMYPRLVLLREFLTEDGAIFISIDDNEHASLKLIMDEIFGARNFIEMFSWYKTYSPSNLSQKSKKCLEYVYCYEKRRNSSRFKGLLKVNPADNPLIKVNNQKKTLKFPKDMVECTLKEDFFFEKGKYGTKVNEVILKNDVWFRKGRFEDDLILEAKFIWTQENLEQELAKKTRIIFKGKSLAPRYDKAAYNPEVPRNLIDANDFVGTTEEGGKELAEIFNGEKVFEFPKPSSLIKYLINFVTSKGDLVLDSFAGTGTTGHAVLQLNKEDGGNRRFILVEMDEHICQNVTAERLKRVINGYSDKEPLGGGFRYCKLGEPLFDQFGNIRQEVSFNDLAHHIFFAETGVPLPSNARRDSPLIAIHKGVAYYLLFNGILGDKSVNGGNILTSKILEQLPEHNGPKVIYGEGTRLSLSRLRKANITFKQVPYEIKTS